MIKKNLYYIYGEHLNSDVDGILFNTFKDFHKWIFENGLPAEFQLNDRSGKILIRYRNEGSVTKLYYDHAVPGSIIFEICNQEARLKQEE